MSVYVKDLWFISARSLLMLLLLFNKSELNYYYYNSKLHL